MAGNALSVASSHGQEASEHSADVNAQEDFGNSAFQAAAWRGMRAPHRF